VTLEPTARVTGDVTYETLSIAAGAAIEGRLTRKDAAIVSIAPAAAKPAPAPAPSVAEKPKLAKPAKMTAKAEEPGLLAAAAAPAAAAAG
jgi:cytoskeletal protein CcmA (bactofilin family)